MKKIFLAIFAMAAFNAAIAADSVRIHGKLVDMGTQSVNMSYDGATSLLGKKGDILIQTDKDGNFDIRVKLDNPSYYRISRNTLYLSPGDDMEVYITTSNSDAKFSGKGSEANTYMKGRLFPKGGSFIGEIKREQLNNFETTAKIIDSLSIVRLKQLNDVKNASDKFKQNEAARVYADIVNSYICFLYYTKNKEYTSKEGIAKHKQNIVPKVKSLIDKFNKDQFLDVAVVRDVIGECINDNNYKDIAFSPKTIELFKAYEYASKLDQEASEVVVKEVNKFAETLKNLEIKVVLNEKIAFCQKIMSGTDATDLTLEAEDGTISHLSKYKGKYIYVDLWATWCGPCIAESPKFHELAKKYAGKDIQFVAVSTDTKKGEWLRYIKGKESIVPQYNCTNSKELGDGWQIKYIPRFLLIDKNFKIINAYAPRPSSEDIGPLLEKLLSN